MLVIIIPCVRLDSLYILHFISFQQQRRTLGRPRVIRATVEGKKLGPESLGGRAGTGTQVPSPVQASVCKDLVARTARCLWGMQLLKLCVGFLGGPMA